jgi:hypothetical protein
MLKSKEGIQAPRTWAELQFALELAGGEEKHFLKLMRRP